MITETSLANIALGHLGVAPIANLQETSSVPASHVRRMWDLVRDQLQRGYAWNFCIKRTILTASATPPSYGWTVAYPLPSDCLRVLTINGYGAGSTNLFEMESGSIITNLATLQLRYIRRVDQVSLWASDFCELFGYELAKAIAPLFSQQPSMMQLLDSLAQPARIRAEATNSAETKPRVHKHGQFPSAYDNARMLTGYGMFLNGVQTEAERPAYDYE